MKVFKLIIKWFLSFLFILIGITNCFGSFIDSLLMIEELFLSNILKLTGIGFFVVGLVISPLFDIFTKKINKRFSGLRKLILSFGIIVISIICSLIFSNLYTNSILGYIWSIVLTLLFILFYFYILYLTNKYKYNDKVKNKWYVVLIVAIILLSIPYFIIKGLIVNSYNSLMKQFNIDFLESKKIENVNLNEKDYYIFDDLKIENIFKDYTIAHEQDEPYKSITLINRDNDKIKGIAITNFDMFKDNYNEVVKHKEKNILYKLHPYANFVLSNEINSEQNYYKYLKDNQKLSMFDSIGEIYTSWIFANISLSSITSFQLIKHHNYDISIMTGNSSDKGSVKMIEIINDDKVYTITLFITNHYTDEELYSFISTIKLS